MQNFRAYTVTKLQIITHCEKSLIEQNLRFSYHIVKTPGNTAKTPHNAAKIQQRQKESDLKQSDGWSSVTLFLNSQLESINESWPNMLFKF